MFRMILMCAAAAGVAMGAFGCAAPAPRFLGHDAAARGAIDRAFAAAALQPPVISPDGRWLAHLHVDDPAQWPHPDPVTGRAMHGVSLHVTPLQPLGPSIDVLPHGACWAAFSPDSRCLAAVRYDRPGWARLVIADLPDAGQQLAQPPPTVVLGVGLSHILTPAFSPDGRRLAMAGFDTHLGRARVYVLDLTTRQFDQAPLPSEGQWQVRPVWDDDDGLEYLTAGGPILLRHRWSPGSSRADAVGELHIEHDNPYALLEALGLLRPRQPAEAIDDGLEK